MRKLNSKPQRIWGFLPCLSLYCDWLSRQLTFYWEPNQSVHGLLSLTVIEKNRFDKTLNPLSNFASSPHFTLIIRSGSWCMVQSGDHFRSWDHLRYLFADHLQAYTSFKRYCPATPDNDLESSDYLYHFGKRSKYPRFCGFSNCYLMTSPCHFIINMAITHMIF